MKKYQQYALPLIRKEYPSNLCMKLCSTSVQQVGKSKEHKYELKRIIDNKVNIINGNVNVDMKQTLSCYYLDLENASNIGMETFMLEKLQHEVSTNMEEQLINTMKNCALNPDLGGSKELYDIHVDDLDEEYMSEQIVSEIFDRSQYIGYLTKMGMGNFLICSSDIFTIISYSRYYTKNNMIEDRYNRVQQVGYLDKYNQKINIFVDYNHKESYSIVGLNGTESGESGIVFVPNIPYIFREEKMNKGNSPQINIESGWVIGGDVINSGHFYRYTKYHNVKEGIGKMRIIR